MAYDKMGDLAYSLCGNCLPVAFIGSGLSRNYCDWVGLIKILCEYVGENTSEIEDLLKLSHIDADQLLVLADYLRSKVNTLPFRDLMQRNFTGKTDDIPHVFDVIVQSPFSFFLTTNYDVTGRFKYTTCGRFKMHHPRSFISRLFPLGCQPGFPAGLRFCGATGSCAL